MENTDMVQLTVELKGAKLTTVTLSMDDAMAITMCFRAEVVWRVTDAKGNSITTN